MCASQVDSRKQSELAVEAFDRWQRRHAAAAFPVAVMRKFLDDRASSLAALVAYYAFFSLFPLLLVFVSVLALRSPSDGRSKRSGTCLGSGSAALSAPGCEVSSS